MLLLHGYPLSGALFARVREALQDDYKVLTVDHHGYGLSDAPETSENVATYAGDALAVMDHLASSRWAARSPCRCTSRRRTDSRASC